MHLSIKPLQNLLGCIQVRCIISDVQFLNLKKKKSIMQFLESLFLDSILDHK